MVFGKESKNEKLALQIGTGILLASVWTVILLGIFDFNIGLLVILVIVTVVYLLTLVMNLGKGIASDTDSKTGPDRYGKSY